MLPFVCLEKLSSVKKLNSWLDAKLATLLHVWYRAIFIGWCCSKHDMGLKHNLEVTCISFNNSKLYCLTDLSTITKIARPTPTTAHVNFAPSIEFQTAQSVSGMAGQFVLQYDVEREKDVGDLLVMKVFYQASNVMNNCLFELPYKAQVTDV
jgi:hypothetical protein